MTMQLRIVTTDGQAYDGPAQKLFCRTVGGDVCILPRHCNYCTPVGIGEARVTTEDGAVRRAACNGGLLTVMGDEVTLAASTFEWAEDIDLERAKDAKARAEALLKQDLSKEEKVFAERRLARANTRIRVASQKSE